MPGRAQPRRPAHKKSDSHPAHSQPAADDNPPAETVGQRIRRLRLQRCLSQKQAAVPGVTDAYLSRIESGQRHPSLTALRALAERLDVTVDYLETGQSIPHPALRELRIADAELELHLNGDLDKAEATFQAELAHRPRSTHLAARALTGLGLIAARRGHHRQAIELLTKAANTRTLPPHLRPNLYETLGGSYINAGQPLSAVTLYERCLHHAREHSPNDPTLTIRFATGLATAHSARGATKEAASTLAIAIHAAGISAGSIQRAAACRETARSAWARGDAEAALSHIRRAIGLAEAIEDARELARAYLATAQLINPDSTDEEIGARLARAEELLKVAGDASDLGLVRAEQAKLAATHGDPTAALQYARDAAALLDRDPDRRSVGRHALRSLTQPPTTSRRLRRTSRSPWTT